MAKYKIRISGYVTVHWAPNKNKAKKEVRELLNNIEQGIYGTDISVDFKGKNMKINRCQKEND